MMAVAVSVLATAILGYLDHITGYELGFFAFYFIPVGYATWVSGRPAGVILSVLCALVWFSVDLASGHAYSSDWYGVWNTGIRLVSFLIITLALSDIKGHLARERRLSAQLREALDQVKELRGLLPICAGCKKIRNDQGYWEQIELYIRSHTHAEFTHSICPECARRLYPELYGEGERPA